MVATDQSVHQVIFTVEVTANLGAYIDSLRANYLLPTLEYFNGGPVDKSDYGLDYGSTRYALVLFYAADCAPEPASTCLASTTSVHKFLSWFDNIQFIGGAGEGFSHITEGLSTAIQVFDDLQTFQEPNTSLQKHCILMCNSPPYPIPCMESANYSSYMAEQLATLMSEHQISLSIISPRKIPALYKLYEMAGGDSQLSSTKNFARDRRHLVLLKGYQLKERPVSPTLASTAPVDKVDGKSVMNVASSANIKKPMVGETPQNAMKPPTTQSFGAANQMPNQTVMGIPGQMKPRLSTPITSFSTMAPPTSSLPVIVTVNPNMGCFTSSSTSAPTNQGVNPNLAKTSTMFFPQNEIRGSLPSGAQMNPRWSHPQSIPNTSQPITIQSQNNMPLLTDRLMKAPIVGPAGQTRMMNAQQQKPQMAPGNQITQTPTSNQPVMVTTVTGTSLQSQLMASKVQQMSNLGGGTTKVNIIPQQAPGISQQNLQLPNIVSSQQPINQQMANTVTSTIGMQSQQNMQAIAAQSTVNMNQPQQQQQQMMVRNRPKEPIMIWQGTLKWRQFRGKPDNPNDQNKGMRSNLCRISSNAINGEPEIIADKWPQVLFMQMMPHNLLSNVTQFFNDAKTVTFHFTNPESETIQSLNKLMSSGYVGCVHLNSHGVQPITIRVIMLLYSADKKAHIGLIPKDQTNFVSAILKLVSNSQRKVQDQEKQKMMQMSGGSVAPGTPTVQNPSTANRPANIQLASAQVAPVSNQPGIILSQGNTMTVSGSQMTQIPQPNQQQMAAPNQQAPNQQSQQDLARQIEAERQKNLLEIQQLQQTLQAAQQKEMQFKAAQERQHVLQEPSIVVQPRMNQLQQVPQNAANNPQLRHLLQQQAQQQARHPSQQQQQQQQQQIILQQQQQQQQQQPVPQPMQQSTSTVNTQQPGFMSDVDNIMDFL